MNSSQINAEQKAVNVMESIVAHDFSKVIKSYKKEHKANDEEAEFVLTQLQRWLTLCSRPCKTSATRMNIGFAPVPLCA